MYIICDIKRAVEASGPNKEARAEIFALVEKLAERLHTALEVAQEVAEANPGAFDDEQRDRMQSAADLLNGDRSGLAAVFGLLGELFGAKVVVQNVEVGPDESIADAIARTLKDNEDSTKPATKH